eukprot:4791158-Lingulodinium_polyedra.AAC.1
MGRRQPGAGLSNPSQAHSFISTTRRTNAILDPRVARPGWAAPSARPWPPVPRPRPHRQSQANQSIR